MAHVCVCVCVTERHCIFLKAGGHTDAHTYFQTHVLGEGIVPGLNHTKLYGTVVHCPRFLARFQPHRNEWNTVAQQVPDGTQPHARTRRRQDTQRGGTPPPQGGGTVCTCSHRTHLITHQQGGFQSQAGTVSQAHCLWLGELCKGLNLLIFILSCRSMLTEFLNIAPNHTHTHTHNPLPQQVLCPTQCGR